MQHRIIRIKPAEAMSLVESGKAVMLDVVAPVSRAHMRRQIAGAVRIEPEEFSARYQEFLPRDKQIIAYCTCEDEITSADVAQDLRRHGYQAFALKGGYAAWEEAGYPTEPKKRPAAKAQ